MKQKGNLSISTLVTTTQLKKELGKVEKTLRKELLQLEGRMENLEENSRKYRDDITSRLDDVMRQLGILNQENIVGAQQTRELRHQVDTHEIRIVKLEKTSLRHYSALLFEDSTSKLHLNSEVLSFPHLTLCF